MRLALPGLLMSGVALAAFGAPAAQAETPVWRAHADHVLGTSFDMAVATPSRLEAEMAFAAARDEIARLDRTLSAWRADSELAALNASEQSHVSRDLYAVISACEDWRARSGGAYSARLGALEQQWAVAGDEVPDAQALCDAALAAERADVLLDPASRTIQRPTAVGFAPDGLAKGYIIDAALTAARRAAPCARGMMLNIGGDLRCWGDEGEQRGWTASVADPANLADNAQPAARVVLVDRALAVSGPGPRDRMVGGEPRSHLLDPRTGQPAPRQQSAVVAPTAADADALATALAILPAEEGVKLAEATPGAEALVFVADGRRLSTTGWDGLTLPYDAATQSCAAPLPAGYGVEVEFTLPKIAASNYKKPYVVAWVTDQNKALVKTLLIIGGKRQYQEDNYVWYRRYGRKTPGIVESTAKPTRAPGRYVVAWDGTDEKGARMPQGRYVINIEAAREHGGHAYQTIEVDLGTAPVTASAAAKDELGPSSARYAKGK